MNDELKLAFLADDFERFDTVRKCGKLQVSN
jgi:hypothetical protein